MKYAIEFRSGSYFMGPKFDRGGTIGQAMLLDSKDEAKQYADYNVPWVWFNGGMVVSVRIGSRP